MAKGRKPTAAGLSRRRTARATYPQRSGGSGSSPHTSRSKKWSGPRAASARASLSASRQRAGAVERSASASPASRKQGGSPSRPASAARAYLQRVGVATSPLPDGRFAVGGSTAATLAATRVVLLGLRHLHSTRRGRRPA